jgi:hypothetical protein
VKSGWLVGVVAVAVLAYITLNSLRTEGVGTEGLQRGAELPPFAVPLAGSARKGDANVFRGPGRGPDGEPPACTVRGRDVLNVCELAARGPVVLAFVVTRSGDCERQVDVLDRVAPQVPGVAFAAVAVREDRERLRRLVRARRWTVPVGYDHDGAVGNLYGLGAVCPLLTFAGRDRRVAGTHLGFLAADVLERAARALAAGRPLPEPGAAAAPGPPFATGRPSARAAPGPPFATGRPSARAAPGPPFATGRPSAVAAPAAAVPRAS